MSRSTKLHVKGEERQLYMDTIRDGGGVVALDTAIVDADFAGQVGEKHGAMRVTRRAFAAEPPAS